MENKLRERVKEIDRKYGYLLLEAGCKGSNYVIYLDPHQGSGFGAEDKATMKAMRRVSLRDSTPLLHSLAHITRDLDRTYKFNSVEDC